MNIGGILLRPLYWLAGKVFAIWARPAIQPEAPGELIGNPDAAVCYVLETGGLADLLALERACKLHGLPSPSESFKCCGRREARRIVVMRRMQGFFFPRPSTNGSERLRRLVEAADARQQELLLIPVAIYWGRSPQKEHSVFKLLFAENWEVAGRIRKFFATLLLGRNTLLRFSDPLPLSSIVASDLDSEVAFRKVSRILRVHFRQRRTATVGPDLSNRRTLVNQVLRTPGGRKAIANEAGDDPAA
jgi:glycerol-3-phosphate O-acyltransferase